MVGQKMCAIHIVLIIGSLFLMSCAVKAEPINLQPTFSQTVELTTTLPPLKSPTPTLKPSLTPTLTPTLKPTETHTSTPTSEPFTKLEDLKPLLSEEDQVKILSAFQKRFGYTWQSAKVWDKRDAEWVIYFVSEGKLIDLVERPLQISISATQTINMLVGTRFYYPDINGDIQSILAPIVMELPDGTIYYSGGLPRDNRMDWKKEEVMQKVEEKNLDCINCIGDNKGGLISFKFIPDFDESEELWLKEFGRVNEEWSAIYFEKNYLRSYIEYHAEELERFLNSGDPALGMIIPWQMSQSLEKLSIDWEN